MVFGLYYAFYEQFAISSEMLLFLIQNYQDIYNCFSLHCIENEGLYCLLIHDFESEIKGWMV